jgi:ADP-heptose:LPS heptosyltransferase
MRAAIHWRASTPLAAARQSADDFDVGEDAFLDTAAVMESLDLIITCDTSIAHRAGGLDRPTWVALKNAPDWRWMLDREDTHGIQVCVYSDRDVEETGTMCLIGWCKNCGK